MEWLDGHPLSMRLVLPHLENTDPQALLAALRGLAPALPDDGVGGRTGSLAASITYSFDHLSADARHLLPVLCLFHGVADLAVLGIFSAQPGVPSRFRGRATGAWKAVLDEAAGVGLLTPIGGAMYRIHPALPGYLADRWRAEDGAAFEEQRSAAERALLDAYTALGDWLTRQIRTGNAALAFAVIGHQRRTLGALLAYALDHYLWTQAQQLAQPLNDYWDSRGLFEEARAWVDRARLALEDSDGQPPSLDTAGGALWLFLVGSEANRALNAHQLDAAERTYLRIRDMLAVQPHKHTQQRRLAVTYHQLGMVAEVRGRLVEAEEWYRRSLAIKEELGNRPGMAMSYGQLGLLAEQRGEPGQALEWTVRCVALFDEFPHPSTGPGPKHLARLAAVLGMEALEDTWLTGTGAALPEAVHAKVNEMIKRIEEQTSD